MKMVIDVVIPVFRPDEKVEKCIIGLLKQTISIRKINLVVSFENEKDKEYIQRYSKFEKISITYIEQKEFDYAAVKDDWMKETDADFILFMVQDAAPADAKMLENMLPYFEELRTAIVYGRHITDADCGEIERFTRFFNYPPRSMVKTKEDEKRLGIKLYFNSNVCALYRKSNYMKTTGFGRRVISCEDTIIAWKVIRQGDQVVYAADARVLHYHTYGLLEQFRRNFDTGVSYTDHKEIAQAMVSSNEGIHLVKETARYLLKKGKIELLFPLFIQSGIKYIGYQMGRHYKMLPYKLRILCTRNKRYWEKKEE